MSFLFGGGTTGASQQSQQAQQSANAATQRFIEQRTAEARADVQRLFPQAQQLGAQGFQGALDVLGGGLPQQLSAFQQGNIGAQQVTGDTFSQIQNAILGLPVNTAAFAPQNIQTDLSFLSGLTVPGLQDPNAPVPGPPVDDVVPPDFTLPPGFRPPTGGGFSGGFGGGGGFLDLIGEGFGRDFGPSIRQTSGLRSIAIPGNQQPQPTFIPEPQSVGITPQVFSAPVAQQPILAPAIQPQQIAAPNNLLDLISGGRGLLGGSNFNIGQF